MQGTTAATRANATLLSSSTVWGWLLGFFALATIASTVIAKRRCVS